MQKWMTLASEYVILNEPYHKTRKDRCLLPNGMEIDYYVQEYPNWVNAVVLTPDREIVVVRQYRHGNGVVMMETPGGMVEKDEDPAKAVVREVAEETGYSTSQSPIYLGSFYPNPATSNNMAATYLLLDAHRQQDQNLDATEDIVVTTVPFVEFGRMIREGQVSHLFSALGYFLAKDYLGL